MFNERAVENKKAINVGYQFGRKSVKKEEGERKKAMEGGKAGRGDIKASSIVRRDKTPLNHNPAEKNRAVIIWKRMT